MNTRNSYLELIILIGIVLLFQVEFVQKLIDPIKEYFPLLWIVFIIWSINTRIKYLKGKTSDQLRIPTNNDDYNRIMPFIFGVLLSVGGFFALKYMDSDKILWSLIVVSGVLLFISGFLFVPSGIIEIKNNKLSFANGARKKTIGIEEIKNIKLNNRDIVLTDQKDKKHYVSHMNLNESDYQNISDFLNKNLTNKIEIKTYGNS